jgi:hypothetical protein
MLLQLEGEAPAMVRVAGQELEDQEIQRSLEDV